MIGIIISILIIAIAAGVAVMAKTQMLLSKAAIWAPAFSVAFAAACLLTGIGASVVYKMLVC